MGCRVLVVEDAAFVRKMIASIVYQNGHEVVAQVANGQQAIDAYREYRPDAVIMDIVMPVLDGIAATRAICEQNPGAHVIICSAVAERGIIARAITAGARDFVVKPVSTERLLVALERIATGTRQPGTGGDNNGNAVGGSG